jgi:Tol biopolymer transport system component
MSDATFSPDGTRAVVVVGTSLWVMDLERGTKIRLTQENEGANRYPVWSRDGQRVIFGSNRGGDWDPYSVPAGGGPTKRLLARTGSQVPLSVGPDGTILLGERTQGTAADLILLAPDGTVSPLVVSTAGKTCGRLSVDGRTVAYVSDETGREEVYLRSVAKPETAVVVSNDGGNEPLWSPDGKELFYRHGDSFLVDSVGTGPVVRSQPRKLFDMKAAAGRTSNESSYGISPDGRRFLIVQPDARAVPTELRVVENWFEELKGKVPVR